MTLEIELLNSVSDAWRASMIRACWQGGLALAAVWIVSLLFTRLSSSTKVWLWRLAFAKCLIAFFWATPIDLPLLKAPALEQTAAFDEPAVTGANKQQNHVWVRAVPSELKVSGSSWLFLLWVIGMTGCGVRLVSRFQRSRGILRGSERSEDSMLNAEIERVAAHFRLKHVPVILISSQAGTPLLTGLIRPRIVLPQSITREMSPERIRMILAHETAHVVRRDLTWMWLFSFVEGFFFFHPMVWVAGRDLRTHQEMACDALAIKGAGTCAYDYANMLLQVVSRKRDAKPALVLNMIETKQTLQRRIMAMKTTRSISRVKVLATGTFLALIAIVGLVPWRVIAQESTPQEEITKLKEENARLKEELQKAKSGHENRSLSETAGILTSRIEREVAEEVDRDLAEAKAKLDQLLANHDESDPLIRQKKAELQALETIREKMPLVEKSVRLGLQAAQEQLEKLLLKYTSEHPLVQQKRSQVDALENVFRRISRSRPSAAVNPLSPEEKELLSKEIELAEQQVALAQKRFEVGTATQMEVIQATRDLFAARRELAGHEKDKGEQRKVVQDEIKLMEDALKTVEAKIRIGELRAGSEIEIQKQLLKLKRELLSLQ